MAVITTKEQILKEQKAVLRHLRIAPRKVRLVAGVLKRLPVNEAEAQLLISPKKAAKPLIKLLRSAVANAKNNAQLKPENLFIKEIKVNQGPILKRSLPRAMGRATLIQKKTSHITLVLGELENLKKPRFKIEKPEKILKKDKIKKLKEKTEPEKPKTPERKTPEKEVVAKPKEKLGFIKRMFRRKSI